MSIELEDDYSQQITQELDLDQNQVQEYFFVEGTEKQREELWANTLHQDNPNQHIEIKNKELYSFLKHLSSIGYGVGIYFDISEEFGPIDVEYEITQFDFPVEKNTIFQKFERDVLTPLKNEQARLVTVYHKDF